MISVPSVAIEQNDDLVGVSRGARLVLDLLVHDLLALLLVDGLHEHTLVLEHVTLALHVQGVVEVLVDLLGVAVLLEKTAEHAQSAHPDDSGRHTGVLATNALTGAGVATLALGGEVLALAVAGVHLGGLLDDEAILREL